MSTETRVRCRVIFSGRVQGVGFRHTTSMIVSGFPITGYVMNCRDGTVEFVAEGARRDVLELTRLVGEAMGSRITGTREAWEPATGEFSRFEVRHP